MSFVPHYGDRPSSRALTHPSLHLRDARDAQIILEAVRRNMLPLVKRRLMASERDSLGPGHVYVWEEAEDEGGLLRWTDGRRWSQSRMRGDFLFYEEKVETTQDERDAKAARRAKRAADPNAVMPPSTRRKNRPSKPNGLTKQTYSATIYLPGVDQGKKWHCVAYFQVKNYMNLPVIDQYENLARIRVPDGVIMTTKTVPLRPDRLSEYSDDEDTTSSGTLYSGQSSPLSTPPAYDSLQLSRVDFNGATRDRGPVPLPSFASINPSLGGRVTMSRDGSTPGNSVLPPPSTSKYAPLSSEDRRALNSFRVVL